MIIQKLELDKILEKTAVFAFSEVVKDKISAILPEKNIEAAEKLLTQTGDAITVLASHKPSLDFYDISETVDRAKVGSALVPADFLRVKRNIDCLRSLKKAVEESNGVDSLKDITAWVRNCDELAQKISNAIESESEIKDSASEKLYSLRRAIVRANAKLKDRLDSFTHQSEMSKYLQDNIVTIRGGRYVLPVKSECRSSVKGLVHDISSTGATVFIEPFAIVEANNELITLKTEEANEIERILAELGNDVAKNSSELIRGQEVLTECGIIFAKAEYSKHINGFRPKLNYCESIELKGARHPLIDKNKVVPVDISLKNDRVLLISGPNTGGKTVALKTVGLFSLMAACGFFIPADIGSEIAIFDNIFCDIGDSQSIVQSLSTFSAHITNLTHITERMDDRSLVLLDEVGDGTDPDEGAALAVAIIKKLLLCGSAAVVTTHFDSVKQFGLATDGVASACMQFDSENFRPTYKLINGAAGSSYALEIAEKIGLGSDIISDARAALSAEKIAFDKVMKEVESLRASLYEEQSAISLAHAQAEENRRATQKLRDEYESKLADIKEQARNAIRRREDDYIEKADKLIEQIKEKLRSADEQALFEARSLAKKLHSEEYSSPVTSVISDSSANIAVGSAVYVNGINKEGCVVALRGKKATVAIGSVKTDVPVASLSLIENKQKPQTKTAPTGRVEPVNKEVMLLGYTVDDATTELDRIISDLPPRSVLRIVHGKGTGALGKGIQNYLRRQPRISSFRYGRYGEGDTGVTIAEIK